MATFKQIQATKNLIENHGNFYKAMRAAGYSHNSAKIPDNLRKSKGFKELFDEFVPESKVTEKLNYLLDASHLDHYVFPVAMENEEIRELIEDIPGCKLRKISVGETAKRAYFWTPDNHSIKEAIDIALKVRGAYAPQKISIEDPNDSLNDEELDQKIATLEKMKAERVPE
jgi:hypothetical protein